MQRPVLGCISIALAWAGSIEAARLLPASAPAPGLSASRLQTPPARVDPPPRYAQRARLNRYCSTCHNERLLTAGLRLDTVDVARVGERADVWEKVVPKLSSGAMPPAGRP